MHLKQENGNLHHLRKIRDSYEKIVIALECDLTQTQDGIKIIRALDFLFWGEVRTVRS